MAKKRKGSRKFTDLNFSKADLAMNSKQTVAKVGYHLLLRVKPKTAVNAVYALKVLAKSQKIKSIKKVVGFRTKSMIKGIKKAGKRAKTAITKRTKTKTYRKKNGRTIQKSKRLAKYNNKPVLLSKRGQPYIITSSGRAKFIPRSYA